VVLNRQRTVDEYNCQYTLNPYSGCTFGCIYCYSTRTDFWVKNLRRRGQEPYEVRPKENLIRRLEEELGRLQNLPNGEKEVQIGNAYEPYPNMEMELTLTRQVLEVFSNHPDWTVHLVTKSDLILRDIDVIQRIPHFQAEITITSLTHDRQLEPNAPTVRRRLEVVKALSDADIFVRIMVMPVIPPYTDRDSIISEGRRKGAEAFKFKDLRHFRPEQIRV
jgi:DNA repair photolyase